MTDPIRKWYDLCGRCRIRRVGEIYAPSQRYVAIVASTCPHKDKCEREVMNGYAIITDAEAKSQTFQPRVPDDYLKDLS